MTYAYDPFGLQPSADEPEPCPWDGSFATEDGECVVELAGVGVSVGGGVRIIGTAFHHAWGLARQAMGAVGRALRGAGGAVVDGVQAIKTAVAALESMAACGVGCMG